MIAQTLIAPTTGAVATQQAIPSQNHDSIFVGADFLAGAEEADLYINVGGTWVVVADPATSLPVKLTATVPCVRLAGGPLYGVTKDATAAACGVYWGPGSRVY